ncbi:MAG: hypothetical protein AAF321_09385 [Pseudomonadota bacterium]
MTTPILLSVAAFLINVAVAGSVAVGLFAALPRMDEVYGPDSAARRILACLYAAIAGASFVGLGALAFGAPQIALAIGAVLFPFQIAYKAATLPAVGLGNPVVRANLFIILPLAAATWAIWA